jgi:hypothetical protein
VDNLYLLANSTLVDLSGLGELATVGGGFYLTTNPVLTSLAGLGALTSVSGVFQVVNNEDLPDCEACDLLEQLTSGPASVDVHDNLDDSCTPVPDSCP